MPLRRLLTGRLRRRRAEVDQVWHEATCSQDDAYQAAVRRLLEQVRGRAA